MTTFDVPSIAVPGFTSEATFAAGVVRLTLGGTADVRAVEPLAKLMPQLHDAAVGAGATEVLVDLLTLEFMNSSCFKAMVTWIAQLRDVAPAQQYHVRFLSNPAMHWQRRSLQALSCFATDLVKVET